MMRVLDRCPGCSSTKLRPYSFTLEADRRCAIHFAQSRCRSCDLVFSNPMANADELEAFYVHEYYEHVEEAYYVDRPDLEQLVRRRAASEVEGLRKIFGPYVRSGVLFEIGAGYGSLLVAARQLGFAVAGVEPSERAARFARETMGLTSVKTGMFEPTDWPEGFCDAVYAFHVIEHVPDLAGFVTGIFKILKPGGMAFLGTENHHNSWVVYRRLRSWIKGRSLPEFQTADHHTFYFSEKSLKYVLERGGFETIRSLAYTGTPGETLIQKLARYRFRSAFSRAAFYLMHFGDALPGRGNRVVIWCRKPASAGIVERAEGRACMTRRRISEQKGESPSAASAQP